MVIFLQQARTWPALMSRWTRVERHMRHFHPLVGFASTVHSFVYVFAVAVVCKYQYGCLWKLSTPLNIPHVPNPSDFYSPAFLLHPSPHKLPPNYSSRIFVYLSSHLSHLLLVVLTYLVLVQVLSCNSIPIKPSTICPYYIH